MAERLAFPIELRVEPGRGAAARLHLQLREAILEGRLATGFRLPPTRELAHMVGTARATVVVAYDMLVAEGYARVRQGDGTFVESVRRAPAPTSRPPLSGPSAAGGAGPPRFDLRLGSPDTSYFPFDAWRRLESRGWRATGRQPDGPFDPAGVASLRQAIVGHASYSRAVSCSADDIVVTAGAQQAFDLLARTLVAVPGTVVAVEDPAYPPMRAAFAAAGAQVVAVPVDEEGLIVSAVPPAARVICVTPSHQFPLGVSMSPARRAALLDHARRHEAYVVEDDYDCEYRYDSRPLDALQTLAPSRVCYVGTFSKTMFPALRLGYAIVPEAIRERLMELRRLSDGFGAPAPQLALAEFIGEGHLHRHLRRMRRLYAERRGRLQDGLTARLAGRIAILPSKAGLHFSLRLVGPPDWVRIEQRRRELDVAFERCDRYAVSDLADPTCAVGFGLLKDDQVAACVERLAEIFA